MGGRANTPVSEHVQVHAIVSSMTGSTRDGWLSVRNLFQVIAVFITQELLSCRAGEAELCGAAWLDLVHAAESQIQEEAAVRSLGRADHPKHTSLHILTSSLLRPSMKCPAPNTHKARAILIQDIAS